MIGQNGRKYFPKDDFFDVIDEQKKAYFLGLIFADGYVNDNLNKMRITLQERDGYILEELSRCLYKNKSPLKFKISGENRSDVMCVDVFSKHMRDTLVGYGCIQNKSLVLEFPKNIPEPMLHHFIRGFFDGNGYVKVNISKHNQPVFSITSTKMFCEGLEMAFKSNCGVKQMFTIIPHKVKNRNNTIRTLYVKRISDIIKIREYMYRDSEIHLNRKKDKFFLIEYKNLGKPIEQVDSLGNVIKKFVSIKEASDILGIHYSGIAFCCRGERPKTHGMMFRIQQ